MAEQKVMPRSGKYQFTGADGSLGYRHGLTYYLNVSSDERYPVIITRGLERGGLCPYGSVAAFWDNWRPVDFGPTGDE